MKPNPSLQDHGRNEEIINILKRLGSLKAEYPPELLAARRAAFVLQMEQQEKGNIENEQDSSRQFIQHLENLKAFQVEYPAKLLAARRAAFVDQIERYGRAQSTADVRFEDLELIRLFKKLKSAEADYPPTLMSARRAAFGRELARMGSASVLEALYKFIRNLFSDKRKMLSMPAMNLMRTSLVIAALMLAVFMGSLLGVPGQPFRATSSPGAVSQPGGYFTVTSTGEVARVICKPGYLPPLCMAKAVVESDDLTYQGNGSARPAVAKDALPDHGGIHKAAYVNDGLYGRKTSWISNSAYSWIKIDLGKAATINTIAFGKDRLGNSAGGDPGQFVVAIALADNIYADGNSSNDHVEYREVYDSEQADFDGIVSGSETILAQFGPVTARFIKITFANPGTAVDEVDAFMIQPSVLANHATKKPRDNSSKVFPTSVPGTLVMSMPTNTALPAPTNTPVPADTATAVPTATSAPTDTPKPIPTDTPQAPTDTPRPAPTDTSAPAPTDTSIPFSINVVQPSDTSVPDTRVQPGDITATSIPVQP